MKLRFGFLLLLVFCLSLVINLRGQNSSALLQPAVLSSHESGLHKKISEYALYTVNPALLKQIVSNQAPSLQVLLPFENGLQLELELQEITESGFQVYTGSQQQRIAVDYQQGAHYRGKIAGQPNSLVAISFFQNEIIGVLADSRGNINFGTLRNAQKKELQAIAYREKAHQNPPRAICDGGVELAGLPAIVFSPELAKSSTSLCFTQYLEADFAFYQQRDSSVAAAVNWLTGAWNVVAAIYELHDVTATISEIVVWTEPDTYNHTSTTTGLNGFRDAMTLSDFNGDLAHLITATEGEGGGRAFIRSICNNAPNLRTAYSRVQEFYNELPEYSFSVYVMTHELGHNLGSSHSHRCVWNSNSTQIDDTGNLWAFNEGEFIEGTFCFDEEAPILPVEGATIMSYGHLFEEVGINFALGFGPQPAAVIRAQLMNCSNCNSGFGCTDSLAHNYNSLAINDNGTCQTCTDGFQNGTETGIDCGGPKCQPCPVFSYSIGGQLRFPNGNGLANTRVLITSPTRVDTLTSDSTGNFIEANFPQDSQFLVRPISPAYLPGEPNGINVLDVVAIQRHILGLSTTPFSPYQLLAADVDGSGAVTVTDLVHIVQYILAIRTAFVTGPPWFFIDANHVFTDPTQPWLDDYPTFLTLEQLSTDSLRNDFIAIQRGGVRAASFAP